MQSPFLQGFILHLPYLPVRGALDALVLDHLNPVVVRIQDKGDVAHATVSQALLEGNIDRVKSVAGRLEVIDRDTYRAEKIHVLARTTRQTHRRDTVKLTDVAESLRLRITVVVDGALLLLRAVVPCQLEQAFPLCDTVLRTLLDLGVRLGITQEIEIELGIGILNGPDQSHAHGLLVELQAGLGILDTQHGMVQTVGARVSSGREILIGATDDLHPVAIGVLGKSNVSHTALGQLLLESISGVLDALAGSLDVIDGDGDVAETAVGLGVTIDNAVVGVILGTVIVAELQHRIAVGEMAVTTLQRGRAIVGEEVVAELPFGEIELLDDIHTEELVELQRSLWVFDPQHRV